MSPVLLLAAALAATAAHPFAVTYRDFGTVTVPDRPFTPGAGYALRFEGCWAKGGPEAVCGFTLRAETALTVTSRGNAAHAVAADGTRLRVCCMFQQGDPRGYPIQGAGVADPAAAVLETPVAAGATAGFLLRIPDARDRGPVASVVFSRGGGDPGVSVPVRIEALPQTP